MSIDEDTLMQSGGAGSQTQSNTDDETDNSSSSPSEEDGAEDTEVEKLLAGKYKSAEELERAYKELESKLGNYKTIEEKAAAFDHLSKMQNSVSAPKMPSAADFVSADGSVDWVGYNAFIQTQARLEAQRAVQEQIDVDKAERDYPYLATDKKAAGFVVNAYRNGEYRSIYEAAKAFDELRLSASSEAKKAGAQEKEREIAQKVRSGSERASARSNEESGLTVESFSKLSLEEKRKIIEGFSRKT
jgi:hypothetical protein